MLDIFKAEAGYSTGRYSAALKAGLVDFGGEGGNGWTFWLQRNNFWLDGDMLRTELLQFLDSGRLWRLRLELEERGAEDIPGPYGLGGYITAKANIDSEMSRSVFEVTAGKGYKPWKYLSIHADARYVSYSDDRWTGESDFFDLWAGLRTDLGGSGWVAWGIGVAPHRFDRWYFDFTGDGRESFLLDQGVFWNVNPVRKDAILERLGEAEKEMSENWSLTLEAGWTF